MSAPAIITPLIQRSGHDCGLAAVATLLHLPYEEVRGVATPLFPACLEEGLSTREVLRLLRRLGRKVSSGPPPHEWDDETGLLLVRVKRSYHWVVVFNGSVIDPMNLATYIPEAYFRSLKASPSRYIRL